MTGSYRGMSGVSATGFDQWAGYPSEVLVNMQTNAGLRGMLHTDWVSGVQPEEWRRLPMEQAIRCLSASGPRGPRQREEPFGPTRSIFTISLAHSRKADRYWPITTPASKSPATRRSASMVGELPSQCRQLCLWRRLGAVGAAQHRHEVVYLFGHNRQRRNGQRQLKALGQP